MLERLADLLREYTTANAGQGPSSTKLVYVHAGLASVYCATVATLGGVSAYLFQGHADGVFWAAVGALWVNALAFASSVQKGQHRAAAKVALGQQAGEGKP